MKLILKKCFYVLIIFLSLSCRLIDAFADTIEEELTKECVLCHKESLEEDKKMRNRHFPYRRGICLICHTLTCGEFTAGDVNKSCTICHNLAYKREKAAHFSFDVSESQCISCHNMHGSNEKGLIQESIHQKSFQTKCLVCHTLNVKGKMGIRENIPQTCIKCHEIEEEQKEAVRHPLFIKKDCLACHDAHSKSTDKFKKQFLIDQCISCHDSMPTSHHIYNIKSSDQIKPSGLEWLTKEGKISCLSCHSPHISRNNFLLRKPLVEGLMCFTCHDQPNKKEDGINEK